MISIKRLTYTQKSALLQALQKLCSIFWGPDLEKCREILGENYFLPFDVVGTIPSDDEQDILEKYQESIRNFSDVNAFFNYLEEAYVRLFINAMGGVAAPLYHSCYSDLKGTGTKDSLMGESAVHMKKRFESKGLSLSDNLNEPPDHLAIELEYLYFLLEKGWAEKNKELVSEAFSFASEFMLPWVVELRNHLRSETVCPFYPLSAEMLVAILSLIADHKNDEQWTKS